MDRGEFELIDQISADLSNGDDVVLGIGDDAAVLRLANDVVVTTDLLVENVHFKRLWSPPFQIGRKAVAVNVSDVESMGARPSSVVIGLAIPSYLDHVWVRGFSAGVRDECERAGVSLVGGDLSSADQAVISVTALGDLAGRPAITRAGAQVGDQVAIMGRFGWSGAGLMVLQRGFGSPKELVTEHQCPSVPYGQGRIAAQAGASAMLDISDGLLADLGHICDASGVGIELESASFEIADSIQRVADATGRSALSFVLTGGEDHGLAACFPAASSLPPGWLRVGQVVAGDSVTVDGQAWDGPTGWDHFAR